MVTTIMKKLISCCSLSCTGVGGQGSWLRSPACWLGISEQAAVFPVAGDLQESGNQEREERTESLFPPLNSNDKERICSLGFKCNWRSSALSPGSQAILLVYPGNCYHLRGP